MCNITHVIITKNNNYLLKSHIFNRKYTSFATNILLLNLNFLLKEYYFKLLNICKLVHDKETFIEK